LCCMFLHTITLQKASEKEHFFRSLPRALDCLPLRCVVDCVLQYVLSEEMLREPAIHLFLPDLFQPKHLSHSPSGILPLPSFLTNILPFILTNFSCSNRNVRLSLLYHIPTYLPHLPPNKLCDDIFERQLHSNCESNNLCFRHTSFVRLFNCFFLQKRQKKTTVPFFFHHPSTSFDNVRNFHRTPLFPFPLRPSSPPPPLLSPLSLLLSYLPSSLSFSPSAFDLLLLGTIAE